MNDWSGKPSQHSNYEWAAGEAVGRQDRQDQSQWSRAGYQPSYPPYVPRLDATRQFPRHDQFPQHDIARPKKRSRVGVLVAGTAAVAMAAGAASAVAVVEHSGHASPGATVAAAQEVGKLPAPTASAPRAPKAAAPAGSVEDVSAKVLPSVVKLQIETGQGREEGSGIVLSADGLILTNNHVVAAAAQSSSPDFPRGQQFPGAQLPGYGADEPGPGYGRSMRPSARVSGSVKATVTTSDGQTVPFSVIGTDPADDIAVVKAQNVSGLTPITIGSSKDLKVGQNVVAVGSPLGLQGTVTTGIISALDRPVATGDEQTGQQSVMNAIQTDAAINPGNSGGALVDMNGDLIGVNSAIASLGGAPGGGQAGSIGLGFAIPVDQAKRIADELVSTGRYTQPSLGVQLADSDADGAAVARVIDGGPAANAGLPDGVVITKLDDKVIDGPQALVAAVRSKAPGDTVTLAYADGSGVAQTLTVTLGELQS